MGIRIKDSFWGLLFIVGSALIVASVSIQMGDPDIYWHLKVGEWIVANLAVPRVDVYSWSVPGSPWVAHQWLWEAIMHLLYKYFGVYGLWLLTFSMAVIAGLFIKCGLYRNGISYRNAAAAGGLTPLLLMGWLKPWPQVGVYALFAAYLYVSLRKEWGWKEVGFISAVALVWGNVHSTAVMLSVLLIAELLWYWIIKKEPLTRLKLRILAIPLVGGLTLVNPHGIGLWRYAVEQGLLTGAYRAHIYSWMPYTFSLDAIILVSAFFICGFIFYLAVKQNKEKRLEFFRALFFWIGALFSRIYTPYAVLSTAVLFGLLNLDLGEKSIKRLAILFAAAGLALLLIFGQPRDLEEVSKESNYPVQATRVILDEGLEKVFNAHGWGGYLLWKGVPVYIDGRNDVYGDIIEDFINMTKVQDPLGFYIADTGAETVLFPVNSAVDLSLREAELWEERYRDDVAVIYVRRGWNGKAENE